MTAWLLSISLALVSGAATAQAVMPTDEARKDAAPAAGLVELPEDAQRVVERTAGCAHFAGEASGDGSARDREVASAMDRLDCDALERDAAAMERKYPNDRTLRQLLRAAGRN